jgi:hypothetical protein
MSLFDDARAAVVSMANTRLPAMSQQATDLGATFAAARSQSSGIQASAIASRGQKDPLAAAKSRADPLMNFNWWCDMPVLNGSTALDWFHVEEATLPFITFEQISNYRAGKNYHFAQKYNVGNLQLKFYEDSNGSVAQYINSWQSMVLNAKTGLFYFPKDYKKTISIWILDVAKMTVMCLDYTGTWPLTPDQYQLGSSQSERVVAGCEFSVDEVNIKFGKFASTDIPSVMSTIGKDFPPKLNALPDVFPSNFVDLSFG